MMDAIDGTIVGRDPARRRVSRALRQSLCGDPSRRRPPRPARRRARASTEIELLTSTRVVHVEQDAIGVTRLRCARRGASRRRADRLRRRQVGGARAVCRRRGARLGPRRLSRRRRRRRLPGRSALECRGRLGRPELPSRALPAARRRAIQRGRHLPQPRGRDLGRARRQPRRGAVVLRRHLRARPPAAAPAEELEALGHRRPRADRDTGATGASRCSATPRIRCCSTWRKAPAWRSKTP